MTDEVLRAVMGRGWCDVGTSRMHARAVSARHIYLRSSNQPLRSDRFRNSPTSLIRANTRLQPAESSRSGWPVWQWLRPQLGDLVAHPRRRPVHRAGGEHVFDRLVVADRRIGPGVSIAGSIVKSAGLYAARTCIMWARVCSSRADSSSSACALASAT